MNGKVESRIEFQCTSKIWKWVEVIASCRSNLIKKIKAILSKSKPFKDKREREPTSITAKRTNPACMIDKDMLIPGAETGTDTSASKVNKLLKKRRAYAATRRLVKKLWLGNSERQSGVALVLSLYLRRVDSHSPLGCTGLYSTLNESLTCSPARLHFEEERHWNKFRPCCLCLNSMPESNSNGLELQQSPSNSLDTLG